MSRSIIAAVIASVMQFSLLCAGSKVGIAAEVDRILTSEDHAAKADADAREANQREKQDTQHKEADLLEMPAVRHCLGLQSLQDLEAGAPPRTNGDPFSDLVDEQKQELEKLEEALNDKSDALIRCVTRLRAPSGVGPVGPQGDVARVSGLPSPEGFVESSALVPGLRVQALVGHASDTRLVGVYLQPDDLSALLHKAEDKVSILNTPIFCRAYVIHEFTTEDDAKRFFRSFVASAKKESSRPFDLDDPEVKRIIQGYIDATKQQLGQQVELTGATDLGSIVDTDQDFGLSTIAAMKNQTSRGEIAVPVAGSVVWVRRGKQVLEMSAVAQFSGQASIGRAKDVVLKWMKAASGPE